MILKLNKSNFYTTCDMLADKDPALKSIISQFGYPPFWSRKPGFETLIHIILEQQVSLASAKAAMLKLQQLIKSVTPGRFFVLSDEELKHCYFSRQKIRYSRGLAQALITRELNLKKLAAMPDEEVKQHLQSLPGIGEWTTDVYLMMALHRADCFPLGDLALVNSLKAVKALPAATTKDELALIAVSWKPFRTAAAYLLWHSYLSKKAVSYQPSAISQSST